MVRSRIPCCRALLRNVPLFAVMVGCARLPAEGPGTVNAPDGTPIHYTVSGTSGHPIVFVHGWACDQTYWAAQVPSFAEQHLVVTIDLGGHGLSGTSRLEWTINRFAEDVVAVLEALDLSEAVLIGHSLGGPVVLEAALAAEDRVGAVIGVDTFHDAFADAPFGPLLDALSRDFVETARQFVGTMFIDTSPSELMEHITADMTSQPPVPGIGALQGLNDWGPARMEQALDDLTVPLGLIQTSQFRTNSSIVEARSGTFPAFQLVEMPGLGHFLMAENAAMFNEILRAVMADLAGGM